jgi:hypothetical protein
MYRAATAPKLEKRQAARVGQESRTNAKFQPWERGINADPWHAALVQQGTELRGATAEVEDRGLPFKQQEVGDPGMNVAELFAEDGSIETTGFGTVAEDRVVVVEGNRLGRGHSLVP